MHVLYVASNAKDRSDLLLESEVTELQLRAIVNGLGNARFTFLPDLTVERFAAEVARLKPDILHFTAHGDEKSISLISESGARVVLTADLLSAMLGGAARPRLIYLNACNSKAMASRLTKVTSMVIGTTGQVSNHAARASSALFYQHIFAGESVADAQAAASALLEALSEGKNRLKLFSEIKINPAAEFLRRIPRIVAQFDRLPPKRDNHSQYRFLLGATGLSDSTYQLVFCTDDATFAPSEETLEDDMCLVLRERPVSGVVWSDYP